MLGNKMKLNIARYCLLSGGADPGIKATDLNKPEDITSDDTILGIIREWPPEDTQKILKARQIKEDRRLERTNKRKGMICSF